MAIEKESYRYNSYTNIKAIKDFLELNKKKLSEIDLTTIHILSYLVSIYLDKKTGLRTKEINNKMFIWVSDNLIMKNLILLSIQERQTKNIISKLEKLCFIEREIINNKRYISINKKFLELWRNENWNISPVGYLKRFKPHYFESIKTEFDLHLDLKDLFERFNDNYNLEGKPYNAMDIYNQLRSYLKTCYDNKDTYAKIG